MLVYLASEDKERSSRKVMDPLPGGRNGQPGTLQCVQAQRTSERYGR
jgi:hypothetical protein